MKNPDVTHCSDECLFADFYSTKSKREDSMDAEQWDEKADPWI